MVRAAVRVSELEVHFGRVPAVDGVDFVVEDGELLTLLGPSGCGKTTTLRCIAGLEQPSAGEIEIAGRLVSAPGKGIFVRPERRDIGMVFQSYAIWPHMTVYQNVAFPLEARRVPAREIRKRVGEALELVGLGQFAERSATRLSGGQQQRVALARALVARPRLLLLDEPLSNLDAKLRERTRADLRRLQRQLAITTIYVTHDQVEAMELSDRVLVLQNGRIAQAGTPSEIYERPANRFVADFVGQANFITGRLDASLSADRWYLQTSGGARLVIHHANGLPGQEVVVVLRPHRLTFVDDPDRVLDDASVLPGTVVRSAYLGDRVDCWVDVRGIGELRVDGSADQRLPEGAAVHITFDPRHAEVLAREHEPARAVGG